MAPTEILAEQHYLTFRRLLARTGHRVALLTAAVKGKDRAAALAAVAAGEVAIAVGTHALIQEGVAFRSLGLAVVDEQHRFGVLQREDLRKKGYAADVLVMTATPIPRTLALTAYGDLDVSVVDEKPPGRTPIKTLLRAAGGAAVGGGARSTRGGRGPPGLRRVPAGGRVGEARGREGGHRDGGGVGGRPPWGAGGPAPWPAQGAREGGRHGGLCQRARSRCWWPPP